MPASLKAQGGGLIGWLVTRSLETLPDEVTKQQRRHTMRKGNSLILRLSVVCSVLLAASALADVKLPAVFGNNMVLQRDVKVPVWGAAEPGEPVTVTFRDQKLTAKANAKGKWTVHLKPLEALSPVYAVDRPPKPDERGVQPIDNEVLTVQGKNTIKLTNVLVGDVWVCSGQSNMAMSVRGSRSASKEIAEAKYPRIRLFSVRRTVALRAQADCEGSWSECSPKAVAGFSAVAYFFGRELHKKFGVPIGLIHTSWGGTPAEAWTDRPALEAEPDLLPILARWLRHLENYFEAKKHYEEKLAKWQEAVKKARAEKKRPPRRPRAPIGPNHPHYPSGLYNAMIAPLIPYGIKGAIWYQGESNAGRAYQYRKLFPAMIQGWRKAWKQGDFPFLFVQLANFMKVEAEPKDAPWPELREAQTRTLALPNTAMAVIIDVGEARNIHPKNKQDVGKRLALAAFKVAYGQDIVHSGPTYESMKVEGNKVRIRFKHAGGGLVAKPFTGLVTGHGPTLEKRFGRAITPDLRPKTEVLGFAIAGGDRKFVWANARIDGNTIVVSSPQVPKPVAVRYAWSNNPVCDLYNKEGLPACPFRTDDWPGVTVNNR